MAEADMTPTERAAYERGRADERADVVAKMIKRRKRELASCERMIELLQPEWDKFEARTGHDLYVTRDYADHTSAARTHRKEIDALEWLLSEHMKGTAMIEEASNAGK